MTLTHVRIVGSGLIGTSIGLGLAARGVHVSMVDSDPRAQKLAHDLVGAPAADRSEPELIIVATPVSAFQDVLSEESARYLKSVFIDVASIKSKVKVEVSGIPALSGRFVATHPMAGREIGGPESARADLFQSRPWIIDSSTGSADSRALAVELIDLLGGHLIEMEASEHDKAVALISHLPQIAASLVAKQLLTGSQEWLALSGGGVRDTTRIASSDPELWKEIIAANSQALLPILSSLRADLDGLIASLDEQDAIADVIAKGQEGRARIPGKHGGVSREYTHLPIVIEDKPGQLAALFEECAEAGVNVEDLSIEHSPGQFTGLITLALSHEDAGTLATHLQSRGWNVHSPK